MALAYAGPGAAPELRVINDVVDLGRLNEPHRLRLGAAVMSAPPPPLFERGRLAESIVTQHFARVPVTGAEYLAVTGHELGGIGLLQRDGLVFVDSRVQPHGFNRLITAEGMPAHWMGALVSPFADVIESDEAVGVVLNPHMVWGHFLLEMMARIHLLAKLRDLGRAMRVAVPLDAPEWVRGFIALYFTPVETLFYDSRTQRVRAPCFVLPSMMMTHYLLHPEMNVVVETVRTRVLGADTGPEKDAPKRLYLSRSRHAGWHAITNEAEVEAVMTDLGFTVVHPQELSLREQLRLFAGAECIVSQYSSAAHNAIFAPRGAAVACFGWMNRCQSGIAALRNQPMAYLPSRDGGLIYPPDAHGSRVYQFPIDCAALARTLPRFLGFAGKPLPRGTLSPAAPAAETPTRVPITDGLLGAGQWEYGRNDQTPSTTAMRFLPDGNIGGYDFTNERHWSLDDGHLEIYGENFALTVRFSQATIEGGVVSLLGPYLPDPGLGITLRLARTADAGPTDTTPKE